MTYGLGVRAFLVRLIFQASQGKITVFKMTSSRWILDVGGLVTKLQVGCCGGNCLQDLFTSQESATGNLSVSTGTETALLEGYRVGNDVLRVLFGCGWSSD